jgi:hypothetical protein
VERRHELPRRAWPYATTGRSNCIIASVPSPILKIVQRVCLLRVKLRACGSASAGRLYLQLFSRYAVTAKRLKSGQVTVAVLPGLQRLSSAALAARSRRSTASPISVFSSVLYTAYDVMLKKSAEKIS